MLRREPVVASRANSGARAPELAQAVVRLQAADREAAAAAGTTGVTRRSLGRCGAGERRAVEGGQFDVDTAASFCAAGRAPWFVT